MTRYVIDMTENYREAVTIVTTETRNLRALPFLPTEDQLSTGKAWEEWLEDIEREFRYFRISNPADRKDAMIIYGGKELARLEKSLPDPVGDLNEYEKLRMKLNDYFSPKRNKHYARYMFLKMRPLAGETTVAYATRLREKAYDCEFGATFDDRILEHLIQTIENQQLIQKCISKSWQLSQFLLEAGQIEDILMQIHDMKEPQQDKYIARIQGSKHLYCERSDEEHVPVCNYCGYNRKHREIADCPAYGKECHKCHKLHHFAAVCKAGRFVRPATKHRKKKHRNDKNVDSMKKTLESDSSGSSDEEFIPSSIAHMQVNTLKTIPALNHTDVDHVSWLHEELAKLRFELDKQSKEMELRVETKMTELMENMHHKIKRLLLTNPEEEAHESLVGTRHTAIERIGMSDDDVESCIFANTQRIQEMDFRVSKFEDQSEHKTEKQKWYDWWDNTNRVRLTSNNKDRTDEFEPGEQIKHATRDTQIRQKRKEKERGALVTA